MPDAALRVLIRKYCFHMMLEPGKMRASFYFSQLPRHAKAIMTKPVSLFPAGLGPFPADAANKCRFENILRMLCPLRRC